MTFLCERVIIAWRAKNSWLRTVDGLQVHMRISFQWNHYQSRWNVRTHPWWDWSLAGFRVWCQVLIYKLTSYNLQCLCIDSSLLAVLLIPGISLFSYTQQLAITLYEIELYGTSFQISERALKSRIAFCLHMDYEQHTALIQDLFYWMKCSPHSQYLKSAFIRFALEWLIVPVIFLPSGFTIQAANQASVLWVLFVPSVLLI